MIKFLIHRPIAVLMTFIAILLLGAVATGLLPVSLMPNVDIPEITVQVERQGVSVRELENTIVRPLRQRLMQVAHLDDISSETRDGASLIRLRFKYGSDINYAFIDVNEKVDAAMYAMPRDVDRPAIIKASATDLPVFYINVKPAEATNNSSRFMELCEFTEAVIRKRLEQLPEVAMVDITGQLWPELYLLPDAEQMQSLGLQESQIQQVLKENNITLGSLQVIDGQYQYNIRFSNSLSDVEDVRNLYLKANGRLLQLKDIAEIGIRSQRREGLFLQGHEDALSLAIIKQSDARMEDLKTEVDKLLDIFRRDFPELELTLARDQTGILKLAISNLQQSLVIGGVLAFLIMFLFLRDMRSPWLIGISIPVSLVISLLFFHLVGLSLNIISLSGLILGVGMMIDNSIIVIDNITQRMQRGNTLAQSCINGTNEVMRPLISSVLTTCAVFIPLIYISGISGALFFDQAIAVAIGLGVSLIVSVTLLPTLYRLFWLRADKRKQILPVSTTDKKKRFQLINYETAYEKGWHWVFRNRKWMMPAFLFLIALAGILSWHLKKERFPAFQQQELVVTIDWNERIHLNENRTRVLHLLELMKDKTLQTNSFVGRQQYLMHKDLNLTASEAVIYLHLKETQNLKAIEQEVHKYVRQQYPEANIDFRFPETIFERLFADHEAPFVTRISSQKTKGVPEVQEVNLLIDTLQNHFAQAGIEPVSTNQHIKVRVKPEQLALYEVSQNTLFAKLKAALNAHHIGVLRSRTLYIPIVISDKVKTLNTILQELKIPNSNGLKIPLNQLVEIDRQLSYKTLYGGKEGEYIPIPFMSTGKKTTETLIRQVREVIHNFDMNLSFSGKLFSSKMLLKELLIVMCIALALLYFILAAQFESFTQPLIVLLEVPIDIAGALGLLWLFGGTINLMAMIGIIVMSGIIINDSILKIDTINQLRRQGYGLLNAIETGGHRRLKPILMTSLTTILALLPFLFQNDMGSKLQQPLALTVIGGMTIGTLVSLYFVPLCYYYLYRNKEIATTQ